MSKSVKQTVERVTCWLCHGSGWWLGAPIGAEECEGCYGTGELPKPPPTLIPDHPPEESDR